MRYTGIIIIGLVFLVSCKTSSVTGGYDTEYKEDLTGLRSDILVETRDESEAPEETKATDPTSFTSHIKAELDSINQLITAKNKDQKYVDGYTIQIYTGDDRQEANEAFERAVRLDPSLAPKIHYYQPNYKVKIGQYTDRMEAHEVYTRIKKEFPLALLIPERITVDYD